MVLRQSDKPYEIVHDALAVDLKTLLDDNVNYIDSMLEILRVLKIWQPRLPGLGAFDPQFFMSNVQVPSSPRAIPRNRLLVPIGNYAATLQARPALSYQTACQTKSLQSPLPLTPQHQQPLVMPLKPPSLRHRLAWTTAS